MNPKNYRHTLIRTIKEYTSFERLVPYLIEKLSKNQKIFDKGWHASTVESSVSGLNLNIERYSENSTLILRLNSSLNSPDGLKSYELAFIQDLIQQIRNVEKEKSPTD